MLSRRAVFALFYVTNDRPLVEYHHWLPRPEEQPPLDLSPLTGDVMRHVH